MVNKAHPTAIRHPKLRALAENPVLVLIARGLIPVILAVAGFLALRVEQDHDSTTAITAQLVGIQDTIRAATTNRYTSIDAERDKIAEAAAIGYLRDQFTETRDNHEKRIERLEGKR